MHATEVRVCKKEENKNGIDDDVLEMITMMRGRRRGRGGIGT